MSHVYIPGQGSKLGQTVYVPSSGGHIYIPGHGGNTCQIIYVPSTKK
jgi:hypothetical protein